MQEVYFGLAGDPGQLRKILGFSTGGLSLFETRYLYLEKHAPWFLRLPHFSKSLFKISHIAAIEYLYANEDLTIEQVQEYFLYVDDDSLIELIFLNINLVFLGALDMRLDALDLASKIRLFYFLENNARSKKNTLNLIRTICYHAALTNSLPLLTYCLNKREYAACLDGIVIASRHVWPVDLFNFLMNSLPLEIEIFRVVVKSTVLDMTEEFIVNLIRLLTDYMKDSTPIWNILDTVEEIIGKLDEFSPKMIHLFQAGITMGISENIMFETLRDSKFSDDQEMWEWLNATNV